MIWPFRRKPTTAFVRAYMLQTSGYEPKTIVAGDASEAAEAAFPCAVGSVLVKVVTTGEKFSLWRKSQLDRWERDPLLHDLRPPTSPTTMPRPAPPEVPIPGPGTARRA